MPTDALLEVSGLVINPTEEVSAITDTSMPLSSAWNPSELAQVLSITDSAPRARAIRASSGRSAISIDRLPGASSSTARVRSQNSASYPAMSSGS